MPVNAAPAIGTRPTFIDILFSRIGLFRLSLFIVLYVIILGALTLQVFTGRVTLREGEVAEWDIISPVSGEFETSVDRAETETRRRKKEETVDTVYFIDKAILDTSKASVQDFFGKVRQLHATAPENKEQRDAIRSSLEFNISIKSLYLLTSAQPEKLDLLESIILKTLYEVYIAGVEDVNLPQLREKVQENFKALGLSAEYKLAAEEIISAVLTPNKKVNQEQIQKLQRMARESVEPIKTKLHRGTPIAYRGERITRQHIAVFKALGMYGRGVDMVYIISAAAFELLMLMMYASYLFFYRKKVYRDPKRLVILSLILALTMVLARFIAHGNGHAVPVPAAAMLLVMLVDGPAAILATMLISVLVAMLFNFNISVLLMQCIGGFAAISRSSGIFQRTDLTRAGFSIGVLNMLTVVLVAFLKKTAGGTELMADCVWAGLNGVLSAIFVIGTLPYWESMFNVVTPIRLGEMANPNQALLKRLLIEAPGTYHHSLMVANMAEAAAETIGADPLLARVGGYYHDVGKIKRPDFFVENQIAGQNPHDRISPRLSTIIILSHPRDGVQLAEQYNVPDVVRDIIAQHHGTGVVSFFFRRSQAQEQVPVSDAEFRYEGPVPRTREAAIVMLADSVEAAVRSLEHPTPHKIETLIRKIIKDRLDDGQLDDCALTLKELGRIREAFLHVLGGRFHHRIDYTERSHAPSETDQDQATPAVFDAVGD